MPTRPAAAVRSTPNASTPAPTPPDLPTLHASILTRLAVAINHAALRLQTAAAGQSVFASDADLKATLALLKLAPHLLPLIAPPPPPDEDDANNDLFYTVPSPRAAPLPGPPLIPKCEICGEGPGAHWSDVCPKNPNLRKFRW